MKNLLPLITEENKHLYWAFGLVAGSWAISLMISGVVWLGGRLNNQDPGVVKDKVEDKFIQFGSESAFRQYAAKQESEQDHSYQKVPAELPETWLETQEYSDDITTNGREIFFSQSPGTKIVSATSSAMMRLATTMPVEGELFLHDQTLTILNNKTISGFDITLLEAPKQIWQYTLDGPHELAASQVKDGKLYVVTHAPASANMPCPIPIMKGTQDLGAVCQGIYHWPAASQATELFTAAMIDTVNGQVERTFFWIGSPELTALYMSGESIYVGHYLKENDATLLPEFMPIAAGTLIDQTTKQKILKVSRLDLSDPAKEVEYQHLLNQFSSRFSDNERLRWTTEFTNQFSEFKQLNARDIERTAIIKLGLDSLSIQAAGSVPGKLFGHRPLDEDKGYLRAAVTVGNLWETGQKSTSDVYVLNSSLAETGSIKDLAPGKRVYEVKFMGNRAYVATLKETDPVYILDLSAPDQPKVTGELKIPGYSSYLHPLNETLILGISQEENRVKLALYDVSEPTNPVEKSKYLLDEYWSEVVNNHEAFLYNPITQTFFIRTSKGGNFYSWRQDELSLNYSLVQGRVKQAVYTDETWYVAHEQGLVAVDGNDWRRVSSILW